MAKQKFGLATFGSFEVLSRILSYLIKSHLELNKAKPILGEATLKSFEAFSAIILSH